ncbi:MAG: prepilin-type N-terminal cleavage/methylation domain-containing protein [Planctomycetes bacterium]|nr:prepilin-type N-terminal cleavage/methylation domain-containing protein [Planctomycetota bacterium]
MKRIPPKQGMTLVETMCAVFILGVATTAVVQMVSAIAVQRRLADRRSLAAEEAANLMEQILAMPWPEIADEKFADMSLSKTLQKLGGDPALCISARPQPGPPTSKEIRISIDWVDTGGGRSKPVQLIAWHFRSKETNE